jgi:membrane protease YdiL (CAAX protease family)
LVVAARIVGVILCYLLASVALTVPVVLIEPGLVLGPRLPANALGGPLALAGLAVPSLGGIAMAVAFTRWVDRRPVVTLGLEPSGATGRWLRGAALAALMMGFIVLVWYTLLDGARWAVNPDLGRAGVALVAGLIGFLVQGPSEEVLFRGYVLQIVTARWSLPWGVTVSAVLFALLHTGNAGFGLLPLVNLLLFGVAMALYKVFVDGGQLWGVFALHSVWNWLQQVVFGLENSGNTSAAANTLFQVEPNRGLPSPIWGGGFGPEGTLGATLVLLVLIGRVVIQARASAEIEQSRSDA